LPCVWEGEFRGRLKGKTPHKHQNDRRLKTKS